MLQISKRQARHQRVTMQAGPGAALEVVEAEFLLELLVRLLAHPARLDRGGQALQRGPNRKVAEIVFAFPAAAPFSDEPDFLTWQVAVPRAARSIGQPHAHC